MGKRRNGAGSVYQRKDRKWIAAISIDGKRRVAYAATEWEALSKLRELRQVDRVEKPGNRVADSIGAAQPGHGPPRVHGRWPGGARWQPLVNPTTDRDNEIVQVHESPPQVGCKLPEDNRSLAWSALNTCTRG
jgi:hypothetical protein